MSDLTSASTRPNAYSVWYHFESILDIALVNSEHPFVLDLGCGEGILENEQHDCSFCGIDLSFPRLVYGKGHSLPSTSWVAGDVTNLPFRSDSFDVIVSHQVIEHISDRAAMIREVTRILKPEGILLLSTPIRGRLGRFLARSRNVRGERVLSPDHLSEFSSLEDAVGEITKQSSSHLSLLKTKTRSVQFPLARLVPRLYRRGVTGPLVPAVGYYYDIYLVFRRVK